MMRKVALLATLIGVSASLAVGCAAPGSVEGVVRHDGFTLRADHPLTKPIASGRDRIVVLAEQDSETLRTLQLTLPDAATLPLGKAVSIGRAPEFGSGQQPSLQVSVGAVEIETRSDGVEVISATDATTSSSVRGSITLTELDDAGIAGSFHADLDDGGYVDGEFVAEPESE